MAKGFGGGKFMFGAKGKDMGSKKQPKGRKI